MMVTWVNDISIKRCVPITLVLATAFIFSGEIDRHRPPMKSFIQKSAVKLFTLRVLKIWENYIL